MAELPSARFTFLPRAAGVALAVAVTASGCGSGGDRAASVRSSLSAAEADLPAPPPYRCGRIVAPDAAAARAEVRESWAEWKRRYVQRQGGGLRVRMPGHGADATSSEGMGYGMLLAAYLQDRATLDGLWAYARRHRNPRGLMSWKISPDGRVLDTSAASDGDLDMAFALVVADGRWGGYRRDAEEVIAALMAHAVEPETFVFRPGDWGGSAVANPSYFAPAYHRVFAAYTGDARWDRVRETSYRILAATEAKHAPQTGLQPEWVTISGDSATVDRGFAFHYGYNATRTPWRLAMDAAWNCEPRARDHLAKLNAFFRGVGAGEIVDGYALSGRATGKYHNNAFVAPAMAGAVLSPDTAYARSMWRETVRLRDGKYYEDSLRLLALLFASGEMPPPALRAR